MLTPGQIPQKEPLIRVGIVLPEDAYTSVTVLIPSDADYQLEYQGKCLGLERNQQLIFKHRDKGLELYLQGTVHRTDQEFKIYPIREEKKLIPKAGALLKNVISGRDFHWKKQIDVYLPGTILFRRQEKHLLVINELPLEHYLMCVATSEMGAACPATLIESQTIAARSWMLANVEQKHSSLGMDVCNDDCCQRYQGTTFLTEQSVKGALNTYGQVLMFDQKICDARYSKSCGGVMESFSTIWGGENPAYFQVKADADEEPIEWMKPLSEEINFKRWVKSTPMTFCSPCYIPENELKKYLGNVDEEGSYFRWEEKISQKDLTKNVNQFQAIEAKKIVNLEVLNRGGSGRINRLAVEYLDKNDEHQILLLQSDYSIRQTLHPKFLYSSAFIVIPLMGKSKIPEKFKFIGAGWGHGAGLCQIGALGMALKGFTAEQIVYHYYPGSGLKKIY